MRAQRQPRQRPQPVTRTAARAAAWRWSAAAESHPMPGWLATRGEAAAASLARCRGCGQSHRPGHVSLVVRGTHRKGKDRPGHAYRLRGPKIWLAESLAGPAGRPDPAGGRQRQRVGRVVRQSSSQAAAALQAILVSFCCTKGVLQRATGPPSPTHLAHQLIEHRSHLIRHGC